MLFLPISQKQYLRHPTDFSWSCHILIHWLEVFRACSSNIFYIITQSKDFAFLEGLLFQISSLVSMHVFRVCFSEIINIITQKMLLSWGAAAFPNFPSLVSISKLKIDYHRWPRSFQGLAPFMFVLLSESLIEGMPHQDIRAVIWNNKFNEIHGSYYQRIFIPPEGYCISIYAVICVND